MYSYRDLPHGVFIRVCGRAEVHRNVGQWVVADFMCFQGSHHHGVDRVSQIPMHSDGPGYCTRAEPFFPKS